MVSITPSQTPGWGHVLERMLRAANFKYSPVRDIHATLYVACSLNPSPSPQEFYAQTGEDGHMKANIFLSSRPIYQDFPSKLIGWEPIKHKATCAVTSDETDCWRVEIRISEVR